MGPTDSADDSEFELPQTRIFWLPWRTDEPVGPAQVCHSAVSIAGPKIIAPNATTPAQVFATLLLLAIVCGGGSWALLAYRRRLRAAEEARLRRAVAEAAAGGGGGGGSGGVLGDDLTLDEAISAVESRVGGSSRGAAGGSSAVRAAAGTAADADGAAPSGSTGNKSGGRKAGPRTGTAARAKATPASAAAAAADEVEAAADDVEAGWGVEMTSTAGGPKRAGGAIIKKAVAAPVVEGWDDGWDDEPLGVAVPATTAAAAAAAPAATGAGDEGSDATAGSRAIASAPKAMRLGGGSSQKRGVPTSSRLVNSVSHAAAAEVSVPAGGTGSSSSAQFRIDVEEDERAGLVSK